MLKSITHSLPGQSSLITLACQQRCVLPAVNAVRHIGKRPLVPLPSTPSKGTKLQQANRRSAKVRPASLGQIRSWASRHTGSLVGSHWAAERFFDDLMVRRFIEGTFYDRLLSEVIIKRRLNEINICFFVTGKDAFLTPKVYFLKSFSEKTLADLTKCIVKIEIRTAPDDGPYFF